MTRRHYPNRAQIDQPVPAPGIDSSGRTPRRQLGHVQFLDGGPTYPLVDLGAWTATGSDVFTPGNVVEVAGVPYVCLNETSAGPPTADWELFDETQFYLRADRVWSKLTIFNVWVYFDDPADARVTALLSADSPLYNSPVANIPGADGLAVPGRFRLSPDENLEIEGSFGGGVSGTPIADLPAAWRRDYRKAVVISDDDHNILILVVDAATSATPGRVTAWEALTVGATGSVGSSGATWRTGSGAPSSGLGVNGDLYLNTATGDVYLKSGGAYSVVENIIGPAGPTGPAGPSTSWHDGTGAPSSGLGSNGDYYLNDTNADVYFKSGGTWSVVANIRGATGPTGVAGADGKTVRNGSGAPSSGLGVDGDFYIDTAAEAIYGPKTAGAWGSPTSLVGPAGTTGVDGGIKYVYSTDITNTDPGSGNLKFDSATLSAIISLRISETNADGASMASVIQSWDDSTSAVRSTVTIVKAGAPANVLVFQLTGTISDNGTWDSCAVTYIGSAGSFANGDTVRVFVSRTGDKGDTGATGATGAAGAPGALGGDSLFTWLFGR